MDCLLSFGAESFVFRFGIQKCKDKGIQNYNFAFCSVWVWNLFAHIEGGTQGEGVLELGAEEIIWSLEGLDIGGVEKTT